MDKKNIIKIATLILVISFGFSTIFSMHNISKLIKENNKEESILYANQIDSDIEAIFSGPKAVALGINNKMITDLVEQVDTIPESQLSDTFGAYLKSIVDNFGYDTAFIAPYESHIYYTEHGNSKTIDPSNPDDDWYESFKESGQRFELNIDNDQANGNRSTVYINCRLENENGEFIGSCGVGITLDNISKTLEQFARLDGYSILLASLDGNIQVSDKNVDKTITDKASAVQGVLSDKYKGYLAAYDVSDDYEYVNEKGNDFFIIKYIDDCDWYLIVEYTSNNIPEYYGILVWNIIACIVSLVIVLTVTNVIIYYLEKKSYKYKTDSQMDVMTGMYNRRGFENAINEYRNNEAFKKITIVSMDVNGLKHINDSIGHDAGDELIKGAAKNISRFFEGIGQAYRTGGDEFIVIIDHVIDNPQELIDKFKDTISNWHGDNIKKMSISAGVASYSDCEVECIEELLHVADRRMYMDKAFYYRSGNYFKEES